MQKKTDFPSKIGKDENLTTFCKCYKHPVRSYALQEVVGSSHLELQITLPQSQILWRAMLRYYDVIRC